ncbi:hypothetical protein [Streptomyces sp. NPDC002467]|uniref:hypothetical protein n=1 Tax=Streptomyces sp. NPDC002467 TaxID=3364647 RepID=UPI0036B87302
MIIRMPVFMRVGDGEELEIGELEFPVTGEVTLTGSCAAVATLLRAAADRFERVEEVPSAAADA